VLEVIDQVEALCHHPFYEVSPDPVGGPVLIFEHEFLWEADDRPGPWWPWPPDGTERVVGWAGQASGSGSRSSRRRSKPGCTNSTASP